MKFTLDWLKQHLPLTLPPRELADRLTMAGLELESLAHLGAGLDRVQVGTLERVEKHPDADRLTLCQVRIAGETLPVVCGATNHRAGDKVAVARVGATLPNGMTIRKGRIRGAESHGMLCSVAELGLAPSADGILILPAEAPEGAPLATVLGRDDWLYEVNVTPNRGDCLGVRGIARDLGALLELPLLPLETAVAVDPAVGERHPVAVEIRDGAGCPRYAGRVVEGVRVGESPPWLRQRLEAVGLRPINNVVDVTNLVLMELGQPLHAFDLERLAPPVVVRKARPGERLTTLDEVERTLTGEMTLIADQERSLALAGIMGGQESGVEADTTTLFLESAYFEPVGIARTGRRLGLQSDSRFRFERGTDPQGIVTALDYATRLILELAGGRAGPVVLADAGTWQPAPPIPFRHQRVTRLGGIDLPPEASAGMLTRLGLEPVGNAGEARLYQPPSHRHDLRQEEDLLEEVVRLYGYDRVPTRLPSGPVAAARPDREERQTAQLRRLLAGMGYLEAVNYSFVGAALQHTFDPETPPVALRNPLSEEQGVMRTTLTAGLVECARRNLSRGNHSLRLAEVGRVFLPTPTGSAEPDRVALLLTGAATRRAWHTPQREWDFFDLKGDLERLCTALGLEPLPLERGGPDFLHPGRKALIPAPGGATAGWLGQLHPAVAEELGIDQPVWLLEVAADHLVPTPESRVQSPPISRFPAVDRDFAFVLPRDVPAREVLEEARRAAPELVRRVELFDLYTGSHLPDGFKSLAVGITLQADDRTLTDGEAQQVADAVVSRLGERFGATLRGR